MSIMGVHRALHLQVFGCEMQCSVGRFYSVLTFEQTAKDEKKKKRNNAMLIHVSEAWRGLDLIKKPNKSWASKLRVLAYSANSPIFSWRTYNDNLIDVE